MRPVLKPLDPVALMLRVVWKCEFKVSSNPYANPQRKKRIVTKRKHQRSASRDLD
jgi:hypothetical protein